MFEFYNYTIVDAQGAKVPNLPFLHPVKGYKSIESVPIHRMVDPKDAKKWIKRDGQLIPCTIQDCFIIEFNFFIN